MSDYLWVSCLPLLPIILVVRHFERRLLRPFIVLWTLAVPLDWVQINLLEFYTPRLELATPSFLSIPMAEWVFIVTAPLRVWAYLTIGKFVWDRRP